MQTYQVTTTFDDTFHIRADFRRAESGIEVNNDPDFEEESWSGTPFQVADARHDAERAAIKLIAWWGTEYYLDPSDRERFDSMGVEDYIREHVLVSVD